MGPAERTRMLLRPEPSPLTVDDRRRFVDGFRSRLVRVVADAGRGAGGPARPGPVLADRPVDIDRVTLGRGRGEGTGPSERDRDASVPFRWRPAYTRRSLGLAVVEACATGRFAAPAEAVEIVADEAVAAWRTTGWRTFHWEPWYDGLRPGARARVQAEAVTWATSLWCALDWERLAGRAVIGGPDERAAVSTPVPVRLRARTEARVPRATSGGSVPVDGGSVLLVGSGAPGPRPAEELAFVALVSAVRSPRRPVPSVVLGLWPDAGEERAVTIDPGTLDSAADRVVESVRRTLDGRGAESDPVADGGTVSRPAASASLRPEVVQDRAAPGPGTVAA